jgi:hypothetical protein
MYRLFDRQLLSTTSQASSTNSNDSAPVVVFKCSNNEARVLVDTIRTATGKPLKQLKRYKIKFYLICFRIENRSYMIAIDVCFIGGGT